VYKRQDINRGKRISWFSQNNFEIPIRKTVTHAKVSINLAKQVVQLLKKNDMSADEIGNLLGLPGYTVGSINRGKHKICKELNESFPIRKKEYRNPSNKIFSQYQLNQILDSLFFTNLSMEEISQRFNVSKSTITAINTGRNYRKQNSCYKFPLRQNKEHNIPIFSSVNE
jgi:transposase